MSLSHSCAGKKRRWTPARSWPRVARPGDRLLMRSCLVAGLAGAVAALVAWAGFITAPTYPVGIAPVAVAVGDFNGDGIPDLAVANMTNVGSAKGTVSILLGNGDGTFQAGRDYTLGTRPRSVVIGDFNSDGHLDLAVGNSNAADQPLVSILLGNGDGTFQAIQDFAVPNGVSTLAVGDLNGDGHLDLAAVGLDSMVSVLLGHGDGTFGPATPIPLGNPASFLTVGDLNGDGHLDLAVASSRANTVSVLLGNGDGTFQAAQDYAIGFEAGQVAVGDFNGDGIPDLAVATEALPLRPGFGVSVLLGNGDGTFQAPTHYGVDSALTSLAMGDFNGDGHIDLVGTTTFGPVYVFLGNGDGTFQAARGYAAGNGPDFVAVGDFNGDGHLDLAVSNGGVGIGNDNGRNVSILLGNGDGSFQAALSYAAGHGPWFVTVGDFNGDGIPDLAIANSFLSNTPLSGSLSILLGNGDGSFRAGGTNAAGIGSNSVAVGDLNGDGKVDLVMTSYDEGNPPKAGRTPVSELRVFLGNGDGTFQPAIVYKTERGPNSVVVGDFNGDGIPDLAMAYGGGYAAPGSALGVMLGNGDGTFQPAQNYTVGMAPNSVVAADFNGDGHLDLVVAIRGSDTVSVLLGNGDGSFQAAKSYAAGAGPGPVAVGDFNGDGHLDLAVASGLGVNILLGNGDGTFQAPTTYSYAPGGDHAAISVAVGDFNRDGVLDLAVTDFWAGTVSVLLGNGDGSFQVAKSYGVGVFPRSGAVMDFNGDGFPDIAVGNVNSGTVTVLINAADWPP